MTIWLGIFYGVLQGLTEFLPVSSSGHLVFFNGVFGSTCDFLFFSLLLHLATLFAVVVVLWKEIKFLVRNPFSPLAKNLYISTLITIVIVLVFEGFIKDAFAGTFLPICFMLTAFLLFVTEVYAQKKTTPINTKKSVLMGIAQGIAVLPGISRSGATICTGILCGLSREEASRFSFLMSIPIILASMAYEVLGALTSGTGVIDTPILPSIFGFVSAFLVGVFAVKFMLKALQKIKLWWFSIYLILLAIISLILL